MRTNKAIAFTVALLAATTACVPLAQANWFWPFIGGTVVRGAATTVARGAVTAAARRAALGAAVAGATAGYIVGAEASEGEDITKDQKYCINGQQVYYVPDWATCCLDGTKPKTEVIEVNKAFGK